MLQNRWSKSLNLIRSFFVCTCLVHVKRGTFVFMVLLMHRADFRLTILFGEAIFLFLLEISLLMKMHVSNFQVMKRNHMF